MDILKRSASLRKKKKGDTGKRYGQGEKRRILEFVQNQGRGGITAACRKFGVSYIALRRWMNASGIPSGRGGKTLMAKKTAMGIQKAVQEVKSLRKQITALHRLLRSIV